MASNLCRFVGPSNKKIPTLARKVFGSANHERTALVRTNRELTWLKLVFLDRTWIHAMWSLWSSRMPEDGLLGGKGGYTKRWDFICVWLSQLNTHSNHKINMIIKVMRWLCGYFGAVKPAKTTFGYGKTSPQKWKKRRESLGSQTQVGKCTERKNIPE